VSNLNKDQGRSIDPPTNKTTVHEIISQDAEMGDTLEATPNKNVENIHTNNNHNTGVKMNNTTNTNVAIESQPQKVYDINDIRVIDFTKCVTEDGVSYESAEWKQVSSAATNSIFRIVGFEKLEREVVMKSLRKSFFGQIQRHTNHRFIINEKSMRHIWSEGQFGGKIVSNLWTEVVIQNEDQIQKFEKEKGFSEDMKIIRLKLPLQVSNPEFMDRLNWVILELPESPSDDVISHARYLVQRRNNNDAPVWISDAKMRTLLVKSGKVTVDSAGAISMPLYFDLPSLTNARLVNTSDETKTKAKQISAKIASIADHMNKTELEVGYRLSWLDFMARETGKSQFWKQHFDMNSRSEYCSEVLNIKPDLASQYLTAIRNINILSPEMLANAFRTGNDQKDDTNIPHGYTRYRDLKKYMPVIVSLQEHEEYSQIIEKIFSYELSNRKLMNELPKMIEKMTGEPLPTASPQAISPIEYVRQFSKRVDKSIPDDKKARFNELIAELKSILQSHDGTTVTVESEVVTPEKEAVEITTVNDTTPDVEKEAA
jgi:hypothetical protein